MYKIIAKASCALSVLASFAAAGEICGDWNLELLFMQDLSGSFGDDMLIFRQLAPTLLDDLASEFPGAKFGFSSFVDKPYADSDTKLGYPSDYCYRLHQNLTTDKSAILHEIDTAPLGSGRDAPESQLDNLWHGLMDTNVGWTPASTTTGRPVLKAFILVTDAAFHESGDALKFTSPFQPIPDSDCNDYDYPSTDDIVDAINATGARPIFLVSGTSWPQYQLLVDRLGHGSVQSLDSDSANIVEVVKDGLATVSCQTTPKPVSPVPTTAAPTPGPTVTGPPGATGTAPTGPTGTAPTGPTVTAPTGPTVTAPTGPTDETTTTTTEEEEGTPTAVYVGAAVGGVAVLGAVGAGAAVYAGGAGYTAVVPEMAVEGMEAAGTEVVRDEFIGVNYGDFA